MKKLVALGGILIAVSSMPLSAQSIVPNPRPGTVLWKQSVNELDPYTAPVLDAEGVLWGTRAYPPYQPKGFSTRTVRPIASTLPPFSFPELRLRSRAAFLSDGTAIVQDGDGYAGKVTALGSHPWSTTNLARISPGLVNHRDLYIFPYAPSVSSGTVIVEERLAGLHGKDGEFAFDRLLTVPPPEAFHRIMGFGPGGSVLAIWETHGPSNVLSGFSSSDGRRLFDVMIPNNIRPLDIHALLFRFRNYTVTTEDGLIAMGAFRVPPQGDLESGVWIVDPLRQSEARFVRLEKSSPRVTGLVAARNGLIYVSLGSAGSIDRGGIRGIDPHTGQIVFIPDVADSIDSPPVIAPDGTMYAFGQAGYPRGDGTTIYAIFTGSRGGLARSPWPRSTGDNLNSFREQGVDDGDGDGLTDEQETLNYRTDPRLADTDGDGYSDGVEVQNGSDPLNKSNIPEILEAQIAIKLSFGTNIGQRYRLQSSLDLVGWTNDEGEPFEGTGSKSTQLVEASRARFYWRLVRVD